MKSMQAAKIFVCALVLVFARSTAYADVHVTMQGGRVSIVAKDATLRQILTEWARVGQAKIVNVEKIPGGPISIELTDVPEQYALDVLLRTLSGYVAAPRADVVAGLSIFDRIIVLPTLASVRPALSNAPPPPVFQQPPQFQPAPPPDADVDDQAPPGAAGQNPANPRGPVFNTFPPPQVVNPQGGAQPPGYVPPPGFGAPPGFVPPQQGQPANRPGFPGPTTPGGVAVPGMIVQPPPQQPGQPSTIPSVPPRRPEGQR